MIIEFCSCLCVDQWGPTASLSVNVHLSIYLSVYLTVYVSVYLSIYSSIHPLQALSQNFTRDTSWQFTLSVGFLWNAMLDSKACEGRSGRPRLESEEVIHLSAQLQSKNDFAATLSGSRIECRWPLTPHRDDCYCWLVLLPMESQTYKQIVCFSAPRTMQLTVPCSLDGMRNRESTSNKLKRQAAVSRRILPIITCISGDM